MRGLPAHDFAPDHAFGVLHRDSPFAALHIHNEGDHRDHEDNNPDHQGEGERTPRAVFGFVKQINDAARQSDDDACENQQRHAVADATLRDLLAQPHDEGAARGEGQHDHHAKAPAGSQRVPALFKANRDSERLHGAQDHGDVARPHGDFLAPEFAFFLQLGQRLVDHGEQLQNDGRGDVGHDTQGENRHAANLPAGKQIDETEQTTLLALKVAFERSGVDAGRGDVPAQAIHEQQAQRKQDTFAQVGNPEDVEQLLNHYCKTSTLPPALVIFS